jgi:hypothetical protein
MMHAYDALGKLGGTGSTFLLGDYSKLPNWLFPKISGFQTAPMYLGPPAVSAPAATEEAKPTSYKTANAVRPWRGSNPTND